MSMFAESSASTQPHGIVITPHGQEPAPQVMPGQALTLASRNVHMDRLALVAACDYRTDDLGECSCKGCKRCGLGKGSFPAEPHKVTLMDCLRCVGATT